MKYAPISFKTDYSLLKSIIKISDIIEYATVNNFKYIGILDDNPYSFMDFFDKCKTNDIKPILGMIVNINNYKLYLYIKNINGYKNIIKINELLSCAKLSFNLLIKYLDGITIVLPRCSYNLYKKLLAYCKVYLSYKSTIEYEIAKKITTDIILLNEITYFNKEDSKYLEILYKISKDNYVKDVNYILEANNEEINKLDDFIKDLNFDISFKNRYIPKYCNSKEESLNYLKQLTKKGLTKRLNGKIPKVYVDRLVHEINIIDSMGFVDYFLIVFDYVRYAKRNNIYVGPGRGSAAGSLVSYLLGITEVDPIKYNLLFERFLNPERVTMPDIDVDFEDIKRGDVINYIKNKYGKDKVSLIVAYGTLGSRQVLRDVSKVFNIDDKVVDNLCKMIDSKKNLIENAKNEDISKYIKSNNLGTLYRICIKLEGIKKNTTVHAAGVIISSISLTNIIPTYNINGNVLSGYTAEYLEKLGLLKMDLLALGNLTIIHNIVDLIKKEDSSFNLKNIPLSDKKTFELFQKGDTNMIFQFESLGMKNFLRKLKPNCFDDLVAASALFRPGPMQNIDEYCARKNGLKKVDYPNESLKSILKETHGIIVYQEQIMQILSLMGGYSFAEADLIRRAISKKKLKIMENERIKFVNEAFKRGYTKENANEIYDLIIKFANFGFNKSHSVAYALIGYQMAYLKTNYSNYFELNALNTTISSSSKVGDVIKNAKSRGLKVVKPDINLSSDEYIIENGNIILPLSSIKNISSNVAKQISKNKPYNDFFDFFKANYDKGITKNIVETLIDAGAFNSLNYSKETLKSNIDSAITYLDLCNSLDESLIIKPEIVVSSNNDKDMSELDIFGFYISGHPVTKIRKDNMIKLCDIGKYVNKNIKLAALVQKIKVINTKKNEKMAFIKLEDEDVEVDAVIFPKNNNLIDGINENDLVYIDATISIRNNENQVVINNILKIE